MWYTELSLSFFAFIKLQKCTDCLIDITKLPFDIGVKSKILPNIYFHSNRTEHQHPTNPTYWGMCVISLSTGTGNPKRNTGLHVHVCSS